MQFQIYSLANKAICHDEWLIFTLSGFSFALKLHNVFKAFNLLGTKVNFLFSKWVEIIILVKILCNSGPGDLTDVLVLQK